MTLISENEMKELGEKIGQVLVGGECIDLIGDIGSGKTTLTKGIAKGLGVSETVQSPTFTINRTYNGSGSVHLSHYDFYRLSDPGIMSDELDEVLQNQDTVVVIEWGDIVQSVLPSDHLRITFASPTETSRVLEFDAVGQKATNLVKALQ